MKCRAHLRVREGQGYRDPRPVASVAPGGREDLDRDRISTLENRGQVTDDSTWPLGQGELDLPVQLIDGITEPAGDVDDRHLTYVVSPGVSFAGRLDGPGRSDEPSQDSRSAGQGHLVGRRLLAAGLGWMLDDDHQRLAPAACILFMG